MGISGIRPLSARSLRWTKGKSARPAATPYRGGEAFYRLCPAWEGGCWVMSKLSLAKSMVPMLVSCGAAGMALTGCQNLSKNQAANGELKSITKKVDLERFMGSWYVIAHIPVFLEKDAYNAVESYQLAADGSIPTTFTFNKGSLDGPLKTMNPKGFVYNKETNAEWRMQFLWPFKAAYLITYLSDDYQSTIIGVPSRKYAWIMARTKTIPADKYAALVKELERQGYDLAKLRKVPQGRD